MSIFKQSKAEFTSNDSDSKNWEVSEGFHQAICTSMVDLGDVESTWDGETKVQRKIQFYFAILDSEDQVVKGLTTKQITLSFHERSGLTKLLKDWRQDVDNLSDLLGKRATVYVGKNGKYTNINSIVPPQGKAEIDLADVFVPKFWLVDREGVETGLEYISMEEVGVRPEEGEK